MNMSRERNKLLDLRHPRAGLFIWLYYPSINHTRDKVMAYLEEFFEESVDDSDPRIDAYYLDGRVRLTQFHPANDEGPKVYLGGSISGTHTKPNGDIEYGLPFKRPGMVSLMIKDFNSDIDYDEPRSIRIFLQDIVTLCKHFCPIYGYGHIGFNRFINRVYKEPPPETRIWPYNIFNLEAYPKELWERLETYSKNSQEEWRLRMITETIVEFRLNDLRTLETDNYSEVTCAILGSGDDHYFPSIGYPPSEQWWKE